MNENRYTPLFYSSSVHTAFFLLFLPFSFMHWGLDGRFRFVIFVSFIIKGNQGLIQDIPIPPASSADTGVFSRSP